MSYPFCGRSRPNTLPIVTLGFLLGTSISEGATAADIKVFAARTISISASENVAAVYLDDASAIEERLSADLPDDQDRAETIARQRLQEGGEAFQRGLATAWQSVADAWSLGITTLPAVVVDRRYVVYGEPDVAKAVARIEVYRRERE